MMTTLSIEFPQDIFAILRQSPRELQRDIRIAAAIDWYNRGLVSQGRAAEIADLPRADFIDALSERHIEVTQIDFEGLDKELEFA